MNLAYRISGSRDIKPHLLPDNIDPMATMPRRVSFSC